MDADNDYDDDDNNDIDPITPQGIFAAFNAPILSASNAEVKEIKVLHSLQYVVNIKFSSDTYAAWIKKTVAKRIIFMKTNCLGETVVQDSHFDKLCGSHCQNSVVAKNAVDRKSVV